MALPPRLRKADAAMHTGKARGRNDEEEEDQPLAFSISSLITLSPDLQHQLHVYLPSL